MNLFEARRRRCVRRCVIAVVLVGGAGLIAIGMTFLPWARDDAHHSLTGWEMFRRYGVSFDPYDDDVDLEVGDTTSANATTGVTTLISGVLLVASAAILVTTFDSEARVDYGFLAYPK